MHLKEKQLLSVESSSLRKRTAVDLQYPTQCLAMGSSTNKGWGLADAPATSSPLSNLCYLSTYVLTTWDPVHMFIATSGLSTGLAYLITILSKPHLDISNIIFS